MDNLFSVQIPINNPRVYTWEAEHERRETVTVYYSVSHGPALYAFMGDWMLG